MGTRWARLAVWTACVALARPSLVHAQRAHAQSPAPGATTARVPSGPSDTPQGSHAASTPAPGGLAAPAAPPAPPPPGSTPAPAPAAPATSPPTGAQGGAPGRAPPAATGPALGPESDELAELREVDCDQVQPATTLAEEAAREGVPLPEGLEPAFAAQIQLPELAPRVTPRLLRTLAALRGAHRGHRSLVAWLRRAGRYRARIEAILQSESVPRELLWVVAMESAFNPVDVSTAGATGLWQLMPDAAHTYGLRIDAWVDERRDADRSTRAAARMLRDLRERFGNWELALAAYNMGYNALLRSIRKYNTNDFEVIAAQEAGLPFETAQYVPRILAAAVAARNAGRFEVENVTPDDALIWDDLDLTRSLPLSDLARAAGVDPDALRALNPALLAARTPPADTSRPFVLHVPAGSRARVEAAATTLNVPAARIYRLRHGETVDEVAARYQTTAVELLALSGFGPDVRLEAGTEMFVPDRDPVAPAQSAAPAASTERPVVAVADPPAPPPANRRRVFYRTGPGDDLRTVARALGVARDDLLAWNALDPRARLQPGLWLQAFVQTAPPSARVWDASEVQIVQRGSDDFHDHAVAENGRVRIRVIVRDGDTMASVAARYGVTTGTLARINRRGRHDVLAPGEELVVYVRAEDLQGADGDAADGDSASASSSGAAATVRPGVRHSP